MRRSNGEGTGITKGADGRWHASLSFGVKSGGARDRRHVSGRTRAEVAGKLRALQTKHDSGLVPATGKALTVAAWLGHWLETIASQRVRPSTLQTYATYISNRIVPALGHYRLDLLQPEDVERFYRDAGRPGDRPALSPASIRQCHAILSRALKVATQRGKVARNVCTLVDAPSVRRAEVEPLSAADARAVLLAATDRRNAARWSVALALGLRQGEALGLRWADVNLDAGTLAVRKALQRQTARHGCGATCGRKRAADCPARLGGGLVFVEPKSLAGSRTIALPGPLVEAMRSHRAAQAVERIAAGSLWEDFDLVFAQVSGRPIDPRRDWSDWRALLTLAGVRPARLHDARHTAATLLLQQGVPARVAMQILGHSQISLTLGTYSHVVPELARDAAERMGEALWGTG